MEPPEMTVFFATFIGEFVNIVTKLKSKESLETEEGIQEMMGQVVLRGYLLDFDDIYFYLGETPDSVSQAIERKIVAVIQIEKQPNIFEDILDDMEIPEKGKQN